MPALAAQAFAPAGCLVEQQKTKVWVPAGLCPAGCEEWWSPRGLRILGAPAEGETPLAALGELGAVVGDAGLVAGFLDQALQGYREFAAKVVAATVESDASWSRVQTGVALLRLCALPRLLHLFRALPPAATRGFAENADAATLDSRQVDHSRPTNPSGSADTPGGERSLALQGARGSGLAWVLARYASGSSCLLYTSPSPRDGLLSRMPSSA